MHLWWNFSFSVMFSLLDLKVNPSFISPTLHWVSWFGEDNKIQAGAAPREDTEPAFISGDCVQKWFTCQDTVYKEKSYLEPKQSQKVSSQCLNVFTVLKDQEGQDKGAIHSEKQDWIIIITNSSLNFVYILKYSSNVYFCPSYLDNNIQII